MNIYVFTIFPEMFEGPLNTSILKKAREKKILNIELIDFRPYSPSKHKNVDDAPFGGGAGMVLKPDPIYLALEDKLGDLVTYPGQILLMSPQGVQFNQELAKELAKEQSLVFICGHYEGFDERVRALAHKEISIGDYVLTGGELPAMVIIDAVSRLIPGVLGESESVVSDSFYDGLLEYPHYTRPRSFRGMNVPDVLLSGNHEKIRLWRRKESLRRTLERRPELLEKVNLTKEDLKLLAEIANEEKGTNG
ncbi:MAG: tRNA (guanosine(37)-N1)-methyltransferase TrmD [Bacillota bacterium]|uniref:tRNA (guanine-N(1)-)-methyltransferase n=1 Tax=Thermanaerosceptrum fracticalcis TaxID=1712410 RepID=A0A7G6E1H7_THEFR|nr:tRNA (guanosine(37)-N1)-methyltransferase TrmD [Thermanaerosceptrum fracticalcis]QNB45931.1 tRNA (guanosine(37)-N1)-methyltransferase TrmD [Thermanaerosceptrum fracticalcis]